MGVTGQFLPPKNDFEQACGPVNSAYAVNLTYDRHTLITRKMVPITGRVSSFLVFFEFSREVGGQNNNNRPINLLKVITFSTDYKYTT